MRAFSLIVVGFSLVVLAIALLHNYGLRDDTGPALAPAGEIRVVGAGNTLATLAARLGRPGFFEYDPKTRTAITHASLIIEGELVLGREGEPAAGETLEFATQVCGDMRLEVCRGGALRMFHSQLSTVSRILTTGACSRGYAFCVDGELVMQDSRVSYISGSTSQCLRGGAKATISRSVFSHCDGSALSCVDVDGARIRIAGCDFRGSGNWGVVVQGRGGEPIELRDCLLDARLGDLLISGQGADVRLVDCVFGPAKLIFNQDSGQAAILWTRRIRVIDARTQAPLSGVLVRAESEAGTAGAEPAEARTDAQGLAELALLERVVRPGPGGAASEPVRYRLRLEGPAGELRSEHKDLTVTCKDKEPLVMTAS